MKNIVCAMYILFGLIIVTLTYFNNFEGPILLRGVGWILSIVGILLQLSQYVESYFNPTEKKQS
ncbi:hypothetical protein [Bacillus sp. OAE603]|uniref:hypothetical protein n=1 Tax=Gottfriedia sp. OAE603 TaxID=2663872 RepID=UPI00178B3A67